MAILSHKQEGSLVRWHIRAFMAVVAFRYLCIGYILYQNADLYSQSLLFKYVFQIAPPNTWAVIHWMMGAAAVVVCLRPRVVPIRAVLVTSVGVTSVWAASFFAVEILENVPVALATVFFSSLALKDLIVSSLPFVTPTAVIDANILEHTRLEDIRIEAHIDDVRVQDIQIATKDDALEA
jgi:hypothetical protein